ncbi:MAG: hypothetical protein R6U91_02830 [Bacillota bacterium]
MGEGQKITLQERIKEEAKENRLPCARAFQIASEVGVSTAEVGETCNEMGVKIVNCQLGCF